MDEKTPARTAGIPQEATSFRAVAERMLDAAIRGGKQGLKRIAEEATELLGNPIVILDPSLTILAQTASSTLSNDGEPYVRSLSEGFIVGDSLRFLRESGRLEKIMGSDHPVLTPAAVYEHRGFGDIRYGTIDCSVRVGGYVTSIVSVIGVQRPFEEADLQNVSFVAKMVDLVTRRLEPLHDTEGSQQEFLLADILDEKVTDGSTIRLRLGLLGMGNFDRLVVGYVMPHQRDGKPVQRVRQSAAREVLPNSMSVRYANGIVLLAKAHEGDPSPSGWTLEMLGMSGQCIGLSETFSDAGQIRHAFEQARVAARLGCRLRPEDVAHTYERYVTFVPLLRMEEVGTDMLELCDHAVRKLSASGEQGDTELLETLFLYVFSQHNVDFVTSRLCIHKSTLFYRVGKLEERYGLNLADGRVTCTIMQSFRALLLRETGSPGLAPWIVGDAKAVDRLFDSQP
jgi:hypothetical protein